MPVVLAHRCAPRCRHGPPGEQRRSRSFGRGRIGSGSGARSRRRIRVSPGPCSERDPRCARTTQRRRSADPTSQSTQDVGGTPRSNSSTASAGAVVVGPEVAAESLRTDDIQPAGSFGLRRGRAGQSEPDAKPRSRTCRGSRLRRNTRRGVGSAVTAGKRRVLMEARMTSRPCARSRAASPSASIVLPAAGGPSTDTRSGCETVTASIDWTSRSIKSSRVPVSMACHSHIQRRHISTVSHGISHRPVRKMRPRSSEEPDRRGRRLADQARSWRVTGSRRGRGR